MNHAAAKKFAKAPSDPHLSLALEAGQMGTWEWNLATNEVIWSPALARIHGLDEGGAGFEGTFEAFARDIYPADRARILETISRAVETTSSGYHVEYRIVRPDGVVRWLEARGRLVHDSKGAPERLVGVCSDITERHEGLLRLQLSEAFYSATLLSVADAVVTTDPSGAVTLMNGVAETLTGWRLDEARGRAFDEVVHVVLDHAPLADRRTPQPALLSETRISETRLGAAEDFPSPTSERAPVSVRLPKKLVRRDGTTLAIDDSRAPIRDVHGDVVGQVVVFRDVTEERQEEARQWFIAEASALLTSSLDFNKTLKAIAEFAVPRIADWCSIHALAEDGSLKRLVVAHKDPAKLELARSLQGFARPGAGTAVEVVRTGKPVFVESVSRERLRLAATSEEHFAILESLGLESYMVVPLRAGERVLGAISFITGSGTQLDERDLQMAEELGRRAGMAMENARLYEEAQEARRAAESSAARAALIQEVTAALSEAPTPQIVAEVVTSLGTKAIGAAGASLYELSPSGEELVLARAFGYPKELLTGFQRISMTLHVPLVEAVKAGRPQFYRRRDELEAGFPGLVRQASPFASFAVLPLQVEGRRLGALGISFKSAREFDETERDFMITTSRLCAQALERANLYEAAQKARAEAEAARRTRENLLAIVSHDLRNPLSAIATTASVLAKGDPAREPAGRAAKCGANILRAAQRMDRLIVDLLDLAKIESGRLVIEPQIHEVGSILRDSVEILAPVASGKGLLLTTDTPVQDFRIACDRERVLQVLSNLIGNALKFTEDAGSVTVSVRERDGEARFAVSDTGCGIAPEQLPFIFDRYWQAKSARDGIGLGLSIAKGLVEAHGGRIWVESKVGEGTTFVFALPKDSAIEKRAESSAVKI